MSTTQAAESRTHTSLWVQEITISERDDGDRVILGESGVYEAFTGDRGQLYRSCQSELGRCTGKVYVDRAEGPPVAVGWVFVARRPFADDPSISSLIETWVTTHTGPPTVTTEPHYATE